MFAAEEPWEGLIRRALEAVKRGDFDETKASLDELGFVFVQGRDTNHWTYYHPLLKDDPIFRYPYRLYRGHGKRSRRDRIARWDESQAKRAIHALGAVVASGQEEGGTGDE